MPFYSLGISAFYHDAAACLLRDGEVVLAVEEERLSRSKHDRSFPTRAIAECLAASGIEPGDVDVVVFYEKTLPKLERQIDTWLRAYPRSFRAFVRSVSTYLDGRLNLRRWMEKKHGFKREILFSEHHLSHAAFAFYSSPFDEARVLVADGVGEWATTSLWRAGSDGLVAEREIHFPDSLGLFYSIITAHLGFRVNEDEYKVMGLAGYGDDEFADQMAELLPFAGEAEFRLAQKFLDLAGQRTLSSPRLSELLGPPREPGAELTDRHKSIACSAQLRLEQALLRIEATLPPDTPLCLAGGVALNGAANARLASRRRTHVSFAPGDSGGAIGAAQVGHVAAGNPRPPAPTPFLGPSFDTEDCARAVGESEVSARPLSDAGSDAMVADEIAKGMIVGWFDGAMEFGPRALGHRSILADPRRVEMRDLINRRIKQREPFRPFAPAILEERSAEYFELDRPIPWMTQISAVRPEMRSKIPATVHVDGTARLQSVSARELPRFHALLRAFETRAGVPVVLNTSFNVAGEPIVCSPGDALRCFVAADLDALVLGDLWITKRGK